MDDPKEKRMNKSSPIRIILVSTVLGFLAAFVITRIPITVTDGWQSLGSFPPGEIVSVFLDQYWNKSVKVRDGTVYIYKDTGTWGKLQIERKERPHTWLCRPIHPEGKVDIRYCFLKIDELGLYSREIDLVVMENGEVLTRSKSLRNIPSLLVLLLPCPGSVVGMIVGISIVIWQRMKRKVVDQQNVQE